MYVFQDRGWRNRGSPADARHPVAVGGGHGGRGGGGDGQEDQRDARRLPGQVQEEARAAGEGQKYVEGDGRRWIIQVRFSKMVKLHAAKLRIFKDTVDKKVADSLRLTTNSAKISLFTIYFTSERVQMINKDE